MSSSQQRFSLQFSFGLTVNRIRLEREAEPVRMMLLQLKIRSED
ncbi:Uncharacterised protein [uncultured archaeon]|nr:Uncharacterised protein [uncultured archaeon]